MSLIKSAQIPRKYGAGKGNRTPILSLEGSGHKPDQSDFKQPCAEIPCSFTLNEIKSLRECRHTFSGTLAKQDRAA